MSFTKFPQNDMDDINRERQHLDRLMRQRHEKVKMLHGMPYENHTRQTERSEEERKKYNPLEYRDVNPDSIALDRNAFEKLMKTRRDNYENRRNKNDARMRELNATRTYVLNERQRIMALREKVATRPISPIYNDGRRKDIITDEWEDIRQRPDLEVLRVGWGPSEGTPVKNILMETRIKLPEFKHRVETLVKADEIRKERMSKHYDGRLGVTSYEPWQLPHYELCKSIVEDEVDRLVERLFPKDYTQRDEERLLLDQSISILTKEKAIKLVFEEFILEVTLEEAEAAAKEYKYLQRLSQNMADQACILESEVRSTGNELGRKDTDPLRLKLNEIFYFYKQNRSGALTWKHSQFLKLKNPTDSELRKEKEDKNVIIIDYENIPPIQYKNVTPISSDSLQEKQMWLVKKEFWNKELIYWSKFKVTLSKLTIPSTCRSITCLAMSEKGVYLAIGTELGVVLIYRIKGLINTDFVLTKASVILKTKTSTNNPIVQLSWSLDDTKIVGVSKSGEVTVWVVCGGIAGTSETLKNSVGNLNKFPGVLTRIHRYSKDAQEFVIKRNSRIKVKIVNDQQWTPIFSVFFPSVTLLGSASVLCIGMNINCLLRIDPDETSEIMEEEEEMGKNILQINYAKIHQSDMPNLMLEKKNQSVEIFLQHQHPIIMVTFVERLGDLISVDDQAYVMRWKYEKDYIANGGYWFIPQSKFRIAMEIHLFEPNESEVPHVIYDYSDSKFYGKRPNAERDLEEAGFRSPLFQTKNKKFDYVTNLYRNVTEAITESGAIIHEVTRQMSNNVLLVYQTRIYKSNIHFADILLGCTVNKMENKLVTLILYPPDPSDLMAWIEIVNIDLSSMKACDPRIKVKLGDVQYRDIVTQGTVYFTVTQPVKPFGVSYLVLNLLGHLQIYSLLTGKRVVKTPDTRVKKKEPKYAKVYRGLKIPSNIMQKPLDEIYSYQVKDTLGVLTFSQGTNFLNIIPFNDENTEQDRIDLAVLSHEIQNLPEYKLNAFLDNQNAFYLEKPANVEATIKSWIYETMETAIQKVDGPYLEEMIEIYGADDRQRAYDQIEIPETSRENPETLPTDEPLTTQEEEKEIATETI